MWIMSAAKVLNNKHELSSKNAHYGQKNKTKKTKKTCFEQ